MNKKNDSMPIEPLYLTDAQIARRVGVTAEEWRTMVIVLEKQGFPKPETFFKGRRYWPACKAFLDRRYDLGAHSGPGNPALDGEERWDLINPPVKRRA